MRTSLAGAVLALAVMTAGCGQTPRERAATVPAPTPADAKELKRLRDLPPADAIPPLEAYVNKYPTDPNGHWQLAVALQDTIKVVAGEVPAADRTILERAAEYQ